MKKKIAASVLALILLITAGFTWEGELDPNDFINWDVITMIPPDQNLDSFAMVGNPDKTSIIKRVRLEFWKSYLQKYDYFKNGEVFEYNMTNDPNTDDGKYVRRVYTDEQLRSCIQCHTNDIKLKEPLTEEEELDLLLKRNPGKKWRI